jgi:hypothetical protein
MKKGWRQPIKELISSSIKNRLVWAYMKSRICSIYYIIKKHFYNIGF